MFPRFNLSLNLAAGMQKYLATRKPFEWFHLQVQGVTLHSLYQAMEATTDVTVPLSFCCWGDGGPQKEASYRQTDRCSRFIQREIS